MEKLSFSITINAPREKVWTILWDDKTYREWTTAFHEGSHALTDWKKGSKVLFVDGTGKNGMVSTIADNIPNELMSIQHLGMVKDGIEDTTSEEVKQWAGSFEDYHLKTINGQTELRMEMDINDEFREMFAGIWPKALAKIKDIAER